MTIYEKLLEVQKEIKPIVKDSQNPHFKNKYFDINTLLEVVKPILNKQGIVLTQELTHIEGKIALCTRLSTINKKGDTSTMLFEEITAICPLPECADAQKYGSAITYFRRYALQSLLALEAEDDDGNGSKTPIQKPNTIQTLTSPTSTKSTKEKLEINDDGYDDLSDILSGDK